MVRTWRLPGTISAQRRVVGHLGPDAAVHRPERPEHVTAARRHVQQVFCIRRFRHHPLFAALTGRGVETWTVDPGVWRSSLCELAGRSLTDAEWERFGTAAPTPEC